MNVLASRYSRRLAPALLGVALLVAAPGGAWGQDPAPTADDSDGATSSAPHEPARVTAIEVVGAKRVDRASVRSKIYTAIGRPFSAARLSDDLKRIYRMGFFDDVQAATKEDGQGGIRLIVRVSERPTILEVSYEVEGDSVELDDIKKVVNLKRFQILDEAMVLQNLAKIEELYIEEGHFLVSTRYSTLKRANNGVELILHIDEGRKVEVRQVTIVGNEAVPSETIKGTLFTREGGFLSFLDQSGQFKREFFEQDLQRIQLLYLSKGHVQVVVHDPIVTLSPDKASMSITIRVDEGPRYTVGDIDIAMEDDEWLVPKDELMQRVQMQKDEVFDYTKMQTDIRRLGDVFRDLGYANATVSNDHRLDPDGRIVHFTYRVSRGDLVYFRRITIRGNKGTQDKVVRRELKIAEGDLYSSRGLRRSKERVTVLGFFENVEVAPEQTDDPTRMDVVVKVKEKQTGTFQVGAGFSSLESFIITAQISKNNFLGRGQTVSAQITWSGLRQLFSVSFFEPYFLDTRWTFAFEVFNFQEQFVDFTRLRTGGNMSWGYRLTDDLSLSLTYTLENVDASLHSTDIAIRKLRQAGLTSSLRGTVSLDTRNNRLFPSKGTYTTASVEHAADWLGSENQFTRYLARNRLYFPLWWDWVLKFNTTIGYVVSGDDNPVPLFERFFVGGIFTVRGFERNTIGEKLGITSLPDGNLSPITIGGDKQLIFNAELEIPIFKEMGIRGVVFFDAGNAWAQDEDLSLDLRTAVGFGFRWQSPVGPLRFEWGIPLKPLPGEDPLVFEFTIGNSF